MNTPPSNAKSRKRAESAGRRVEGSDGSAPTPPSAGAAWGGAVLYLLIPGLLIGGVPYAAGPLLGAVLLLAVTPLFGLLRRRPWWRSP